jgi:hypothetical protein
VPGGGGEGSRSEVLNFNPNSGSCYRPVAPADVFSFLLVWFLGQGSGDA